MWTGSTWNDFVGRDLGGKDLLAWVWVIRIEGDVYMYMQMHMPSRQ